MKALKIIVSAASAIILSVAIATNVFAHHINNSHKKTFENKHHAENIYTGNKINNTECEETVGSHFIPDENGNIGNFDGGRCNNTYRGLEFIENISSYTVTETDENGEEVEVEYRINRYGLYCTSCAIKCGHNVCIDEVTLVIRKDDEEALAAGELAEYGNYSPEAIDAFRPKEGHIGECDCEYYDICELQIPTNITYSSHKYKGNRTCTIKKLTKLHEMFCTDCGGYLGSYEKECEITHSRCKQHYNDCAK